MSDMVIYRVIPWDEPWAELEAELGNAVEFDDFIDALQYGNSNYGSRYDLVEVEYV